MAEMEGECSNQIFSILEEWNTVLKGRKLNPSPEPKLT